MPNINAAKKWARASQRRRQRNQDVKSKLKSLYKNAVSPGAPPEAKKHTASAYDKAASRGIIHKNKANRKKSRLAKRSAKAA